MLTADRKRLAWRTAAHKADFVNVLAEVVVANVPLDDLPVAHVPDASLLVASQRLAGVIVPVQHGDVAKTGPGGSEGQATRASEKLN
jgi:hypothetical protein